jgi:predicted negative regulator of RcsB-dependent stress response
MAILESDEANIIDAESTNWRIVVYPILLVLIVGIGGLGYYYYQQDQREQNETAARAALIKATTPEEFLKVADQYPHTEQATLAILSAADASLTKRDFPAAITDYQKITGDSTVDPVLRDSAQLGLAAALEGSGSVDKAIPAFMEVAQRGDKSPYAPYAYNSVARIYDERGDKNNERQILNQAVGLDPDSTFTKQAQYKLKALTAEAQPNLNVTAPAAPVAPSASTPAPAAPAPPKPVAPTK